MGDPLEVRVSASITLGFSWLTWLAESSTEIRRTWSKGFNARAESPKGKEGQWIKTTAGKGWFVYFGDFEEVK